MKGMGMNHSRTIIVGIFVILLMVLCLLAVEVNKSWIEFSAILNGILMPVLTAINIYVFVKLTKAISEKDEIRSRKELEYQKKLLIMQLRKRELDTFDKITTDAFVFDDSYASFEKAMVFVMVYVESFYSSKLSLFELARDSVLSNSIREFGNSIAKIHDDFLEKKEIGKEAILNLFVQKNKIIQALQEITFS